MSNINNESWLLSFGNHQLHLIIFPTEQCNFRCIYCYEDFKLGAISGEVILGIKNLILSRIDELNILNISFFGGEPLLNKKAVLELSEWSKNLCEQKGVYFLGNITTNGYSLDKATFSELIQFGVTSYQITLDGEPKKHNNLRPTINGKPTFEKIYHNLKLMAASNLNFYCTLRFNIADENYDSVKDFIENYSHPFSEDKRFNFHFHPIFGIPSLVLSQSKRIDDLKSLAISKGIFFDTKKEEGGCYAGKANSFVIRADGKIQKCTVALDSDINNIGQINPDGSLSLNDVKLKKWIFAKNKTCPVLSLQIEKLATPYENAGKYI